MQKIQNKIYLEKFKEKEKELMIDEKSSILSSIILLFEQEKFNENDKRLISSIKEKTDVMIETASQNYKNYHNQIEFLQQSNYQGLESFTSASKVLSFEEKYASQFYDFRLNPHISSLLRSAVSSHDITKLKEAQKALSKDHKRAERLQKHMDSLLSLKKLLTEIYSYFQEKV